VSCRDNQGHLFLYILKTSMSFVKTITNFFTFPRLSESFVSRLSQSFLLFQDYQSLLSCGDFQCLPPFTFSKTIRVFYFKDCQSISSRLQCLLYFAKFQGLSLDIPDASYTPSFDKFHCLGSANGRSDGEIARMKLVSLSLLTLSFSTKR